MALLALSLLSRLTLIAIPSRVLCSSLRGVFRRSRLCDLVGAVFSLWPGFSFPDGGFCEFVRGGCLKDKPPEDHLFSWPDGRPVKDFRGSWKALTTATKVKVRIHDFRPSAVRNMMDAGINRDFAKKISGRKTDSIFSRYNIVGANDLADAARKLQARSRA